MRAARTTANGTQNGLNDSLLSRRGLMRRSTSLAIAALALTAAFSAAAFASVDAPTADLTDDGNVEHPIL